MNKKGFTMIELLAAIVVMGILSVLAITGVTRLIEKSKDEKKEDYAQMLKIAAQSYMEANKGELPKRSGNQTYVTAPTLKDKRYLKEDEGGCVEVHKKSNTTYEYVVKLDGNCKSTDDTADQCEINGTKPVFDELKYFLPDFVASLKPRNEMKKSFEPKPIDKKVITVESVGPKPDNGIRITQITDTAKALRPGSPGRKDTMTKVPLFFRNTKTVRNLRAYMDSTFCEVLHTTLNPNGPGAIRIHLIPPRMEENAFHPSVAIINGTDILPVNFIWAVILAELIREINHYDGREIGEEDVRSIQGRTADSVKQMLPVLSRRSTRRSTRSPSA